MKQAIVLALSGIFLGIVLVTVFKSSKAWGDKKDDRANSIQDKSVSGKKTDVPLVKELDESLKKKEKELRKKYA